MNNHASTNQFDTSFGDLPFSIVRGEELLERVREVAHQVSVLTDGLSDGRIPGLDDRGPLVLVTGRPHVDRVLEGSPPVP